MDLGGSASRQLNSDPPPASAQATQPNSALSAHGLPTVVVHAYAEHKITQLYQWQAECLAVPGVSEGRNLVYCAPTSGGKTLVSEVLMLRRVSELKKFAIFVLPYVSIVSEKARYLQALCRRTRLSVKGLHGGSINSVREPFDIAVCTIEKANLLVNYLAEEGKLADGLCSFVIDELHLVGDESRGYLLEVAVSKVLHLAKHAQVIGLSATLPNVEIIAQWLRAALYRTSYRPVPLREYVLVGDVLLNSDGTTARELCLDDLSDDAKRSDASAVVGATWEAVRESHSVLVFCSSKVKCEKTAELLAKLLPDIPGERTHKDARCALISKMQQHPCGLDPILSKTLIRGIAFHHSGLTTEERAHIEQAYCDGVVSVICATSTLAAGVNLPARRVVFQSPYMGLAFLDATQYRQMAGRAGRAGQGTLGESLLIAREKEKRQVLELVRQSLSDVRSRLQGTRHGLQRLLLEVLSVTSLGSGQDLIDFCKSTLLANQKTGQELTGDPVQDYPEIAESMRWLLEHDMVRLDERAQSYHATPLGKAVCASGIEPRQGVFLWRELEKARPCISLDTDLHVCYLATPVDGRADVDWVIFQRVLRHLSSSERRVADRIGIRVDLVDLAAIQGKLPGNIMASVDGARLVRFYNALVLWALLRETPPQVLLQKFALGRGNLQQLQQSAASFTTIVAVFCNRLQWHSMEALIVSFRQRLTFGVRQELVPLMQIPNMDCGVARALYDHGFGTPMTIAGSRPEEVLRILRKTMPSHVPAGELPLANAQALIDAAKNTAKSVVKDKQREAREARKRMRESNQEETRETNQRPSKRLPRNTQSESNRVSDPVCRTGADPASAANASAVQARPILSAQVETASPTPGTLLMSLPQLSTEPRRATVWEQGISRATSVNSSESSCLQLRSAADAADVARGGATNAQSSQFLGSVPAVRQPTLPSDIEMPRPIASHSYPQLGQSLTTPPALRTPPRIATSSSQRTSVDNPSLHRDHEQSTPPGIPGSRPLLTPRNVRTIDSSATSPLPFDQIGDRFDHAAIDGELSSCATPCRAGHEIGAVPERTSPLSPVQLGEGLRRVGRRSLTQRDVEAADASQNAVSPGRTQFSGSARSNPSSFSAMQAPRSWTKTTSEAFFLSSAFACTSQLPLPPLVVHPRGDRQFGRWLETRLSYSRFAGVTIASAIDGTRAVCLTTAPDEAFCLHLPCDSEPLEGAAVIVARWLEDQEHLCITVDSKELVSTFLRYGVDARCTFAEPRVASWLLDPDDKGLMEIKDIAAPLAVRLLPVADGGQMLRGNGVSSLPIDLRTRIMTCWPEAFLSLPVLAALLRRLDAQMLLESFWQVEMPFAAVLAWMEHFGIALDTRDPYHTHSKMVYKTAALEERVREIVGRRVMLSSPEDVGRALFEDLSLPVPNGIRFRRKNNGRLAYRSSFDLLKRLEQSHPMIQHVLEHRQLTHASRRMENLLEAGGPVRHEPLCEHCKKFKVMDSSRNCGVAALSQQAHSPESLPSAEQTSKRIRTEFVQTGTATGRLATAAGSFPLLSLENPFTVKEVWRPTLHEEMTAGLRPEIAARVFVAVASQSPPNPRQLRHGHLHAIENLSCADMFPGGSQTLAKYWIEHGWEEYADEDKARSIAQVLVRHGQNVFSYPANQVWRLAAPVRVDENMPQFHINPRRMLVGDTGRVLLSCDYSQLEVRLMAHFSKDARLVQILHGDGDVFRHVAAGWLKKPEKEVTAEERSGAKRICYGLIYGIGTNRLGGELGIPRAQAQEFQTSFMQEYTGIAAWVRTCQEQARLHGYVETLRGRRRFLPGLASRTRGERAHAERQAVNTACQASAADLVKAGMINIHERLRTGRSHENGGCRMTARMILQMHDELLFEVSETHLDEVRDMVVREMIDAGSELRVPLQVKWKVGRSWGSLE